MSQGTIFLRGRGLDLQHWLGDIQLMGRVLGTNADLVLTRLLDGLAPGGDPWGVAACVIFWGLAGDGASEELLKGGKWGRGHPPRARGPIG